MFRRVGEHDVRPGFDAPHAAAFVQALLRDVQALEQMLDAGMFETGVRRIGAEQEMFLVDDAGRPAPVAVEVLQRLQHGSFTTELARFNLEANLTPRVYGGACLGDMEHELRTLLAAAESAARAAGARVLLTGILPTLQKGDLGLDNMAPEPRYRALDEGMRQLRGGEFRCHIKGTDELQTTHDNVMLEACNTSFQVHFQVAPAEFARLYNLAQAITAPVLAAAVNSPLLLGKRLWHETRVALFQQSFDARSPALRERGQRARVSFGDAWIDSSVLEIWREDIARYRVVLAKDLDEHPEEMVARGVPPPLSALRLHNGTVYRWNRPCYGVTDGKAHLRIENRVLPAGPTVLDEVANAALYFGLMTALAEQHADVRTLLPFDDARANFTAAARYGLDARLVWPKGRTVAAAELLRQDLLPLARSGLAQAGIEAAHAARYLDVIEARVASGRTGARWLLDSLAAVEDGAEGGNQDHRMHTLCVAMLARQQEGEPVHRWPLASGDEVEVRHLSLQRVEQIMTTDLFTVRADDVVDLATAVMAWKHIRHVPVEDDQGRLVGIVSHRDLLGRAARRGQVRATGGEAGAKAEAGAGAGAGAAAAAAAAAAASMDATPLTVASIMQRQPITVTPQTTLLEAIATMRRHDVSCLPVVRDDARLCGVVTERDLLHAAADLLAQHQRER